MLVAAKSYMITWYVISLLHDLLIKRPLEWYVKEKKRSLRTESNEFPSWRILCLRSLKSESGKNEQEPGWFHVPGSCRERKTDPRGLKFWRKDFWVLTVPLWDFCCAVSLSIPLSRLSFLLSLDPIDDFNDFSTIILGAWFWSAS